MVKLANLKIILMAIAALFIGQSPLQAQLVPDRTLNRNNSRVVPVNQTRDNISGGVTRGTNLFHSFQEFNVNFGRQVYFDNAATINNILTRVTGTNISEINGIIGVNGNANLYLINPNGIVFGDGAFLDIRGTFVGTTADGIKLGTNAVFSAADPASSSLLAIEPGALFVNQIRNSSRAIVNQTNLEINPGANLTLSGDSVDSIGTLAAPGGNIFLEAIDGDINIGDINTFDPINGGGNLNISATGTIIVNGIIDLSGGNIELDNFGLLLPLSENITANSGNVRLIAGRDIIFNNGANLFANGFKGGRIDIQTEANLRATNASIRTINTGNVREKGGNINVLARSIELNNSILDTVTVGRIETGDLTVNSDSLNIVNGGILGSLSFADGNTGNLTVNSRQIEIISPDNSLISGILTQTTGAGNTGDLEVETDSLRLESGGQIFTGTFGDGNAGNLTITANTIELIGSSVDALGSSLLNQTIEGTGNAGNLTITADSLRLESGGQISAGTFSDGNGGNLTITAKTIEVVGTNTVVDSLPSGLFTQTEAGGNAGNLTINTDSLRLLNGGQISSATTRQGNAGNLNVNANKIELIGADLVNSLIRPSRIRSGTEGSGNGGELTIRTDNLLITQGARISAESIATGNSGNINLFSNNTRILNDGAINVFSRGGGISGNINIEGNLLRLDRSIINAESNIGSGGDIKITITENLTLANSSRITAAAGVMGVGTGTGGNINIDSPLILAPPGDNLISANAFGGAGGNINIDTSAIFGFPQFLTIDASSTLGIDGTINIIGLSDDINRSTVQESPEILTEARPPEIDDCPLDLTNPTNTEEDNPTPAAIGFCRTHKGTIMAY